MRAGHLAHMSSCVWLRAWHVPGEASRAEAVGNAGMQLDDLSLPSEPPPAPQSSAHEFEA